MGSEQLSARDQANPHSRVEVGGLRRQGQLLAAGKERVFFKGVVLDGSTMLQ